MVEVVVVPADGGTRVGSLGQVMAGLTGSTLVTATPVAALTGGVAPLTTPAVTPKSSGTLWYTQPIRRTRTEAHGGQEVLSNWCRLPCKKGTCSSLAISSATVSSVSLRGIEPGSPVTRHVTSEVTRVGKVTLGNVIDYNYKLKM